MAGRNHRMRAPTLWQTYPNTLGESRSIQRTTCNREKWHDVGSGWVLKRYRADENEKTKERTKASTRTPGSPSFTRPFVGFLPLPEWNTNERNTFTGHTDLQERGRRFLLFRFCLCTAHCLFFAPQCSAPGMGSHSTQRPRSAQQTHVWSSTSPIATLQETRNIERTCVVCARHTELRQK